MFDVELAREILNNIAESLSKIAYRFEDINNSEDFLTSPAGSEKLDSYM